MHCSLTGQPDRAAATCPQPSPSRINHIVTDLHRRTWPAHCFRQKHCATCIASSHSPPHVPGRALSFRQGWLAGQRVHCPVDSSPNHRPPTRPNPTSSQPPELLLPHSPILYYFLVQSGANANVSRSLAGVSEATTHSGPAQREKIFSCYGSVTEERRVRRHIEVSWTGLCWSQVLAEKFKVIGQCHGG
jgi:hypothetical protein